MSSETYHPPYHTHVMVKGLSPHPLPIVLAFTQAIWVFGGLDLTNHEKAVVVSDDGGNSFDENGACIVSVPKARCLFLTRREAETAEECLAIDEAMRANAH